MLIPCRYFRVFQENQYIRKPRAFATEIQRLGQDATPYLRPVVDKQTLTCTGADNEIDSDVSDLWINVNGVRVLEADSNGWLSAPTLIVERAPTNRLL